MAKSAVFWLALAILVHLAGLVWLVPMLIDAPLSGLVLPLAVLAIWSGLLALASKAIFARAVSRPARRLAADIRAFIHSERRQPFAADRYASLPFLPEAVLEMAGRLASARGQMAAAVLTATRAAEAEKQKLGSMLNDLAEGVLVCNWQHRLVFYNKAAMAQLQPFGEMGLERPLFGLIERPPVLHALDVALHQADGGAIPFLARSPDGGVLLHGRLNLVRSGAEVTGYLISFAEAGGQLEALAKRETLLRQLIGDVARLAANAQPSPLATDLAACAAAAQERYRRLLGGWWPMRDIYSADLFDALCRGRQPDGLSLTMTGLPLWLHGDSCLLVPALDCLLGQVARHSTLCDIEAAPRQGGAAILLRWPAAALPLAEAVAAWFGETLAGMAGMTVADVLAHHSDRSWELTAGEGVVELALFLPPGREAVGRPADEILPPRPEFFDFDLLEQGRPGERGALALKALTYVVFDTETTGLHPEAGDQVVSLAAVRIVNGRILTGESFSRLVDPGRPIPPASSAFHGITDEMARGKPPLPVVLPQFKAYAADAVLVAHNAAFDLKFIRMQEKECGLAFDNVVLDTMLLSAYLDGSAEGQSLDALAERYGVSVAGRHTALGDALMTAAVLLRLIASLESRGIRTLDEALAASDMTMQLHDRGLAVR